MLAHTNTLHHSLELLKLNNIISHTDYLLAFKAFHDILPVILNLNFIANLTSVRDQKIILFESTAKLTSLTVLILQLSHGITCQLMQTTLLSMCHLVYIFQKCFCNYILNNMYSIEGFSIR